ncbi:RING finger and WD repeat domain-containing protein 3 [Mortierella sp. NVP85]|nr:RING finger and WD repeat domain-containing protein 3 [Mortierella sp. NVP85]
MDDPTNAIDPSFMVDSSDEAGGNEGDNPGEGSRSTTGAGLYDPPALVLPQQGRAPSQDQDFESRNQVVLRPFLAPGQASIPEPRPRNVETEESTCSICFEPWTNSGTHPLVAIKCGHLFGQSRPAKRKDVRRLWSKNIVVVDTAERDNAIAQLKKEQELRTRSDSDLNNLRLAYDMLKVEMTKLQKKHDHQRESKIRWATF